MLIDNENLCLVSCSLHVPFDVVCVCVGRSVGVSVCAGVNDVQVRFCGSHAFGLVFFFLFVFFRFAGSPVLLASFSHFSNLRFVLVLLFSHVCNCEIVFYAVHIIKISARAKISVYDDPEPSYCSVAIAVAASASV